ncbi:MAG: Ribosomal RNA small subunit methyltransferase F [Candidatus Erwinia impunctatus]|nr:Ribosomal RNA small subunit methyltransferase F [Culicoides impunctatus]
MQSLLPDEEDLQQFIAISQQPLRRSIRINTLKINVSDFLDLIAPFQWQLSPIPWCEEGFWIIREDEDLPLGSTSEHLAGLFYIQEASSMLPVTALFTAIPAPHRVLDMAAAPGSKTTQIAASMKNQGGMVANEYAASRVKVLHANLSRCGISNTAITHFDGRVFGPALPEQFDAILLDAPCSGEGVIRKDSAALKNWSPESNQLIAETQKALLLSAFHALRPGGSLVYSTCTLNMTENQEVIRWLLDLHPEETEILSLANLFEGAERVATPEGFLHVYPQRFDSEGFFVARIRKKSSVPPLSPPQYKVGKFPFSPLSAAEQRTVFEAAQQKGLEWSDTEYQLWQRDNEIWLFPAALTPLFGAIRFSRIGVKLAERFPKGYRWQHEAVIAFAKLSSTPTLALTTEEALCWYHGQDIHPDRTLPADELLLTYQNQPLGIAKKVGNRIKNSYPRELVRDGKLFSPLTYPVQ